jgi:hypothetical protein
MTNPVYEAAIYTRTVSYRNFAGEEQTVSVDFALDPIELLDLIASSANITTKSKSNDPRRKNAEVVDEGKQFRFLRDIANRAAGYPSADGERWLPISDFTDSLAGKAFITKLASSDEDRKEFAEKVMLAPFRAFVGYAKAEPGNTPAEIKKFETMLAQFERVFATTAADDTLEARRARLAAEQAELEKLMSEDDEA